MTAASEERFVFEPLDATRHDRAAFSCGVDPLDRYFRERARQEQDRDIARCFVLYDRVESAVVGYYTLSSMLLAAQDLPPAYAKKLPRYPYLPGILIGRLAVDVRVQGRGFGRRLLMDAFRRAAQASQTVAALALIVDAKDQGAAAFYANYGFAPLGDDPLRLYLPMATIRALVG